MAAGALEAFGLVSEALGLLSMDVQTFIDEVKQKRMGAMGLTPAYVEERLAARADARAAKDWAQADAIREELLQKQIIVMDRPGGVDWRIRV